MTNIPFNRGAINASECISDGWQLVKNDYGLFFGIAIVALLITGCIPCLNLFLAGPIIAGVYYVMLKKMNGEEISFGEMFKGFDWFVPTMIVGLLAAAPEVIAQIFRFGVEFGGESLRGILENQMGRGAETAALANGFIFAAILVMLFFFLFTIVVRVSFMFALPLIVEHNLQVADAVKLSARAAWSNLGGIILLGILEIIISILGVCALIVGLFLVIPVLQAANAIAYRQVFPRTTNFNHPSATPPPPTEYSADYGRPTNYGGF